MELKLRKRTKCLVVTGRSEIATKNVNHSLHIRTNCGSYILYISQHSLNVSLSKLYVVLF